MTSRANFFLFVLILMGLAVVKAEALKPKVNEMCPVLTDEPIELKFKSQHEGQDVYFCCKKCLRKFEESPQKYAENIHYDVDSGHGAHEQQHAEQDHAEDHDDHHLQESPQSSIEWLSVLLGKLHPMLVHFPIAGIYFVFLLQMVRPFYKSKDFKPVIAIMLIISTLSAWVATTAGWVNASNRSFSADEAEILFDHRWLGISTSICLLLCTVAYLKSLSKNGKYFGVFMILLILSISMVSLTGHLGGELVFGEEYFNF